MPYIFLVPQAVQPSACHGDCTAREPRGTAASTWTAQLHSSRLAAHPGLPKHFLFVSPFPRHSLSLPDLLTVLSPSPTLPILLAPYRLFAVSSLTALLPARGTPGCRSSRSLHSPRPHQGRSSGAEGMNRNQPSARASLTPRAPGQAWVSPCPQQERTFWLPAACEGAPGGGALFLLAWGLRAALM